MILPFKVIENAPPGYKARWEKQFVAPGRNRAEGIWRRNQDPRNAEQSGWKDENDARRRVVQFIDSYEFQGNDFVMNAPYLWMNVDLPGKEIDKYEEALETAIRQGGWSRKHDGTWERGELRLASARRAAHPKDVEVGRIFPKGYENFELTLDSGRTQLSGEDKEKPWYVLSKGMRIKDKRENPVMLAHASELAKHGLLPAQVELGCGPSIEAGIPPLHYLHGVYSTSDPLIKTFILDANRDRLIPEAIGNPEEFYERATHMYESCLRANPTPFYHMLKEMHDRGELVGPIFQNNFDGLGNVVGLPENYLRVFIDNSRTNQLEFDPSAKSVVRIGTSADRRGVAWAARKAGLPVVHINPERYDEGDRVITQEIEGAYDCDYFLRATAAELVDQLAKK